MGKSIRIFWWWGRWYIIYIIHCIYVYYLYSVYIQLYIFKYIIRYIISAYKAKKACRALGALASVGQFDTTITNFLVPLQALVDENSRIHCSLNLNTETGRLSSRKPNLQNQPALEKDQFKIR